MLFFFFILQRLCFNFQIDALTSESVLYITHVTSSDYGNYECVARNELGFSTISPRLEVTSAPDTPTLLTILNVTDDTVTLGWTPGFDGGLKASYLIRYRRVNDDGYKYVDVVPHNAITFTIRDLEVNTQYVFSIMAMNKVGNSKFITDLLSANTSSEFFFCSLVSRILLIPMFAFALTRSLFFPRNSLLTN